MNRSEFDRALRRGIRALPKPEVQRFSEYYAEMLDDRIESGITEQDAVAQLGDPAAIAAQILSDESMPGVQHLQNRRNHRLNPWQIALIVLGSPIWVSIALALFSVALSLAAALWSLIVMMWAMEIAFAAGAIGGIVAGIAAIFRGNAWFGIAMLGAGVFCAGATVVWMAFAKWVTVALVRAFVNMKNRLKAKREEKI